MITKLSKTKKGSALAYCLVIMTIVMIVLVSMIQYIVSQIKLSYYNGYKEEAFRVSESGINFYRWYLAHETSGKTAQQISDFWNGGSALGVGSDYQADYQGIGTYSIHVTPPPDGSTIVKVESTGWTYAQPGAKREIQVRFRRPSWSEYMMLTNAFINVGTGAEVYGKMYSNTGIRFDGIAHNIISSSVASFNDPSHGGSSLDFGVHTHVVPADSAAPSYPWPDGTVPDRPSVFTVGREFPVSEISFNSITSDLAAMKSAAQSDRKYFDATSPQRIILKANGTFDVCAVNGYKSSYLGITSYKKTSGSGTCPDCSGQCLSNYEIPDEGVIFVENNAWVEGTVDNKKVTIVAANLSGGSPANIYIGMNNILYTNLDGSDIIGLVAQNDITVIRDCPSNFIIDAALIAQTGEIGINENMSSKTSLTVNGAMASYLQPYFQKGISGFGDRTYNFDNNLLYFPPPYFPTGTEYAVDLWEEK